MTGAWEELIDTGSLGPLGVDLLYKTVRQVSRMRNFPPPQGWEAWTPEAVMETAHEVFAERGPQRLVLLAVRSTDEETFRAQLWQAVANSIVSQRRRTERGRLAERVKDVLPHVPGLIEEGGQLRIGPDQQVSESTSQVRFDDLVHAAAGVSVVVPLWDPTSERNAPIADRDSLVAMIAAVLAAVPAGLTVGGVISVLAVRLGVHDAPEHMEISMLDRAAPPAPEDPSRQAEDLDAGTRLLARLTPNEQMVLPYLEESASVVAQMTGLGRTKAWQTANSTRLKTAQFLADDADAAGALREAVALARSTWGLT